MSSPPADPIQVDQREPEDDPMKGPVQEQEGDAESVGPVASDDSSEEPDEDDDEERKIREGFIVDEDEEEEQDDDEEERRKRRKRRKRRHRHGKLSWLYNRCNLG